MTGRAKRSEPCRSGGGRPAFTMVEMLLALFVVAVGILSVVAFLASERTANARISAQTQAALFADGVFSGLRAESQRATDEGRWEDFWTRFRDGSTGVSVAAPDLWCDSGMVVRASGCTNVNVYRNLPLHAGGVTDVVNTAVRYRMEVAVALPSTDPSSGPWTNRANVTLQVWTTPPPPEGTNEAENARNAAAYEAKALLFYTEFDDPGDL